MFETRCVKIRLKADSIERVREWANEINCRKDEALATLKDEGVAIESVFLDQNSEGDFLIYYMKAENFAEAKKAVAKSIHKIDEYHRQFKEDCWLDGKKLETLIDLENL
jgi:Family of unknown function (DUF6176)